MSLAIAVLRLLIADPVEEGVEDMIFVLSSAASASMGSFFGSFCTFYLHQCPSHNINEPFTRNEDESSNRNEDKHSAGGEATAVSAAATTQNLGTPTVSFLLCQTIPCSASSSQAVDYRNLKFLV